MASSRDLSRRAIGLAGLLLLAACATASPSATLQILKVYATSATDPWLPGLYQCAPSSAAVKLADSDSAQISLRLGEPIPLRNPAYQIGQDDLLVVVHPQTGVGNLTLEQVQRVFAGEVSTWKDVGGADVPIQVWVFAPAEDVQSLFEREVMHGRPTTSLARLAVSAQDMSDSVGSGMGAVGLLPRRWKAGNTREAFSIPAIPVLAILRSDPSQSVAELLHCLQSAQ